MLSIQNSPHISNKLIFLLRFYIYEKKKFSRIYKCIEIKHNHILLKTSKHYIYIYNLSIY